MKLSTIGALEKGDFENAIISETPGGIEAQEARGQRNFVASSTLPKDHYCCTREQFEQMGVVYGDSSDDLFVNVVLPDGWKKEATGHSMHSKLLDAKGRERASIFYKAAFYDRSASITLKCRFSINVAPVCGYDDLNYQESPWHWLVFDCGEIIHTSPDQLEPEPEYNNEDEREAWLAWHDGKKAFRKLGAGWLLAHYPDWENPLAYWD